MMSIPLNRLCMETQDPKEKCGSARVGNPSHRLDISTFYHADVTVNIYIVLQPLLRMGYLPFAPSLRAVLV